MAAMQPANNRSLFQGAQLTAVQTAQTTGLYSKVHSGNHTDCKQQVSIPRCRVDSHAACKQQVSIPRCTVADMQPANNRSPFQGAQLTAMQPENNRSLFQGAQLTAMQPANNRSLFLGAQWQPCSLQATGLYSKVHS